MRPFPFMSPPFDPTKKIELNWLVQQIRDISDASYDTGFEDVAQNYTVTNYTETRTLDASTATAGDVADVLCTLIYDMQKKQTVKD